MIKQKLLLLCKDKTKRNFFIYGIGQAFNLLSPFVVAPWIVFICGDEGFGKVGLGFALALFLILIVDYAFDVKATREVAQNRNDSSQLQKILNTTIFTKLFLLTLVLIVVVPILFLIPIFLKEKELFLLSLTIVFAQVFNPIWLLQGIENFKLVSLLNIGSKVGYVALVFYFTTQSSDYIFINFFLGLSALLFNSIGLIYIKSKYNLTVALPKFSEIQMILRRDFQFCLSQLFLSARQLSPLVLCGYFLGYSVAGQYKIMEQVITLFRTFIQVYLKFFYPSVCYKFVTDKVSGFNFWKRFSLLNFMMVCSALVVIFVFSEEILYYFHLTENTVVQINPIFRLSLVVSLLMAITLPLEQLMFITERNSVYVRITMLVTVVNILLIFSLIPIFDLLGIVFSVIISEILFIIFYFKNSLVHLKNTIRNERNSI